MSRQCALSADRIAELLGADLAPWQRKLLDEVLDPAHKDEHLEWRFRRKIGYVWVWVPNDLPEGNPASTPPDATCNRQYLPPGRNER